MLVGCGPSAPDISIYDAARDGNIEVVKQYIAAGVDVNAKNKRGMTPLHYAAMKGREEIIKLLINGNADINAKTAKRATPLHYAAGSGHKEVVELLIAEGADVNAKEKRAGSPTPLDAAKFVGQSYSPQLKAALKETADLLRKHGGKTSDWLKAADSINIAAKAGHIEAVKQHLAAGTDVNAKDHRKRTPLLIAAFADRKEIAELLIAEGANVNAKGIIGGTVLHNTALNGQKEFAELLITKGADVNAKDNHGTTPLDYAISRNHTETADLLRKHGGKHGTIHGAAGGGDIEAVKGFLANGADVNAKVASGSYQGKTQLDLAIMQGRHETADLLRKHGGKTGAELGVEGK